MCSECPYIPSRLFSLPLRTRFSTLPCFRYHHSPYRPSCCFPRPVPAPSFTSRTPLRNDRPVPLPYHDTTELPFMAASVTFPITYRDLNLAVHPSIMRS